MKNTKKMVALLLALVLVLGCAIGGTIAYLMDKTTTITNTFTSSNVSIELNETKPAGKTEKMVPGLVIEKDPTVTVIANSEKCYLFVKVTKSANFDNFMTYDIREGWNQLKNGDTPVEGVYYREVDTSAENQNFPVLAAIGNYGSGAVAVKKEVTKTMMTKDFAAPTLSFTAYAIQFSHLESVTDAYGAWNLIDKT